MQRSHTKEELMQVAQYWESKIGAFLCTLYPALIPTYYEYEQKALELKKRGIQIIEEEPQEFSNFLLTVKDFVKEFRMIPYVIQLEQIQNAIIGIKNILVGAQKILNNNNVYEDHFIPAATQASKALDTFWKSVGKEKNKITYPGLAHLKNYVTKTRDLLAKSFISLTMPPVHKMSFLANKNGSQPTTQNDAPKSKSHRRRSTLRMGQGTND